MHPSERQLADAILNFPGQIAGYTATEIARLSGVSNATVTRFVRKIGYASFEEARQAVRAEQSAGTALFRVHGDSPPASDRLARHLDQVRSNLDRSFAGFDPQELAALVEAMSGARRLWIVGFRAAQPFARYLAWQVMQVRADVGTLPRDGETLAESLASIGADDCVIVYALRRPARTTEDVVRCLADTGATVALIGDLSELGTWPARFRLYCTTTGAGVLFDHVAVMALSGIIASEMIERSGARGRQRLSRIEDLHDGLNEI